MTFNDLKGCVITNIEGLHIGSEDVFFTLSDGRKFKMYHQQCCCEGVSVEEIHGEVNDILNKEIVFANESSNKDDKPSQYSDSWTWTFYRLMTRESSLVIRWLGESNGYYGEDVDFEEIKNI